MLQRLIKRIWRKMKSQRGRSTMVNAPGWGLVGVVPYVNAQW